jgi:hypothetical protein
VSSYINNDAGRWVQSNLLASISHKPTKRESQLADEYRGWFGAAKLLTPPEGGQPQLNEFHHKAFRIVGVVGGGIYNAPIAWHLIHWSRRQIIINWTWGDGFGTFDFMKLSYLFLLCHTARIRGYIAAHSRKTVELWLSERVHEGQMHQRHPNLEQVMDDFATWCPDNHMVAYPGDRPFPLPHIKRAITDYHKALDHREHGDVAAHKALEAIQAALGMPWVQGASLPPTEPAKTE